MLAVPPIYGNMLRSGDILMSIHIKIMGLDRTYDFFRQLDPPNKLFGCSILAKIPLCMNFKFCVDP